VYKCSEFCFLYNLFTQEKSKEYNADTRLQERRQEKHLVDGLQNGKETTMVALWVHICRRVKREKDVSSIVEKWKRGGLERAVLMERHKKGRNMSMRDRERGHLHPFTHPSNLDYAPRGPRGTPR
jgi:uncharacterized protein (DUF2344 family)